MYKVGDEVLIKGEVIEVMNDVPYPVRVRLGNFDGGLVFTNDELCYADKIVKTYQMGLRDAWELAKKLESMPLEELEKVFGVCGFYSVVKQYKIEEALAKIEAYEKEKEIKVGDVIRSSSYDVIVTRVNLYEFRVLFSDGSVGTIRKDEEFIKTGKHIDIESLLRQIGE